MSTESVEPVGIVERIGTQERESKMENNMKNLEMQYVLKIALSHVRAGDDASALKVSENLIDAPECARRRLTWLHSLVAFDEAARA